MSYWFPHDCNARNDVKLMALHTSYGLAGIGFYWCLIEYMHEGLDPNIPDEDLQLLMQTFKEGEETCKQMLSKCLALGLLCYRDDKQTIYSPRAEEQINKRSSIVEKRKEAGRKGGKKSKYPHIKDSEQKKKAIAKQKKANRNQRRGEESRVNIYGGNSVGVDHRLFGEYVRISGRRINNPEIYVNSLRSLLKKFSEEQIVHAWVSMAKDAWLNGDNPQGVRYFDIEFGLRPKKVEKHLTNFQEKTNG